MTSKEALKRLEFIADKELNTGSKSYKDLQEFWNYKEPLKVIADLVERDTPMIPIKLKWKNTESHYYVCPKCEELVARNDEVFCQDCGQRLDWSEL